MYYNDWQTWPRALTNIKSIVVKLCIDREKVSQVKILKERVMINLFFITRSFLDPLRLLDFLDRMEEKFFELPIHIVADAGYGSEQN